MAWGGRIWRGPEERLSVEEGALRDEMLEAPDSPDLQIFSMSCSDSVANLHQAAQADSRTQSAGPALPRSP